MARRRPDGMNSGVVEHRITLGDLERREFRTLVQSQVELNKVNAYSRGGKTLLIGGAAVGSAYALYQAQALAREWLSESPVIDAASKAVSDAIKWGIDPGTPSPIPLTWRIIGKTLWEYTSGGYPFFKEPGPPGGY
jgi:hypothetical protein